MFLMAIRPISKPNLRAGGVELGSRQPIQTPHDQVQPTAETTKPTPPAPLLGQVDYAELLRQLAAKQEYENRVRETPAPQISQPPQQPARDERKMPISWIIFNRKPFYNHRVRMARLVLFMIPGAIISAIGQNIAGSYYNSATRITGAFGNFMYGMEIGTILLCIGIVLIWEGIRS